MRQFWILIAVLAIAAGTWVAFGGGKGGSGGNAADVTPAPSAVAEPVAPPVAGIASEFAAAAPDNPEPPSEPAPEAPKTAEAAPPAAVADAPEPQPAAPAITPAANAENQTPQVQAAPDQPAEPETTVAAAPATETEPAVETAAAPDTTSDAQEEKPAPSLKAEIVRQPDGSMLVDDRFVVKGAGTPQDPYQVTWDMLVSAGEVYQPRDGRTELPERITMLAGKHVQITGNVAFPLMAQEANELLAMLNQWDGCCIGVPPTPYDAIEVRLKEPAEGPDRFTTFGTVTGRLDVEPHLVGNWLVGLYVMDDATLKPGSYDGFGS